MHTINLPRMVGLTDMLPLLDEVPIEESSVRVDGHELGRWTPTACVLLVSKTIGPDGDMAELVLVNCPADFIKRVGYAATAYGVKHKVVVT